MNISFNEKEKDNLFKAIQKSIKNVVEPFEIKKKPPTIKQILKIDESWPCICDEVNNPINEVKCNSCGLFRRYETLNEYKNEINNLKERLCLNSSFLRKNIDNNITSEEDKVDLFYNFNKDYIKLIKEEESKEFQELIKNNFNDNYNENIDEDNINYYVIDLEWFNEWKNFIQNIEIYPPGPINNKRLLKDNYNKNIFELKSKLIRNKDYIIINQYIWEFLYLNYNGGPIIEVLDDKNLKLEDNIKNISNYFLLSYSNIRDEYIGEEEEQEKDENNNNNTLLESNDNLLTSRTKRKGNKHRINNRYSENENEESLSDKDILFSKEFSSDKKNKNY